jgi:hypothetical protein
MRSALFLWARGRRKLFKFMLWRPLKQCCRRSPERLAKRSLRLEEATGGQEQEARHGRPGKGYHHWSHHPKHSHTPNKSLTHIRRNPRCCHRHKKAWGPNGAIIDPSKGVRNQHRCCKSPFFAVAAAATSQSTPAPRSQSSRWSHQDSEEEIEAII